MFKQKIKEKKNQGLTLKYIKSNNLSENRFGMVFELYYMRHMMLFLTHIIISS
jgi:hypothetical protein